MNKYLIIGKNGQVGWQLHRQLSVLGSVVAIDYPEIDLTKPESIRHWIRETSPDVVINAAAYTAVDKAETETELAQAINGIAPGIIAEATKKINAWLIHYSTDYVFDGTKRTPYVESDLPNPISVYGKSKLAGDLAVQSATDKFLIFRLCWVYDLRGQNFLLTMRRLAREKECVRVVNDQIGCPTWARLIASATAHAIDTVLRTDNRETYTGVYHLAASSFTSWFDFAKTIINDVKEAERKCKLVEPITTEQYPTAAKRPAYSVLDCSKLANKFGIKLPGWIEQYKLAIG
jgi:dTDP-4-dehydrorhamnose reductase